jgi:hypothetical protein
MMRFESTTEALIACVKAAGGSKQVGVKVFPEKVVDQAQRHLLNCLNEDRPERLTPDQVLLIAKMAREVGCHAYAEHVADTLSYASPVPTDPRDEAAELQRQFIAATEQMAQMMARMQVLQESQANPRVRSVA